MAPILHLPRTANPLLGDARRMVIIHTAFTAASLLAATFLSLFIWRAGQDLTKLTIFMGGFALVIPLAFLSNGMLFRQSTAGASISRGLAALGLLYIIVLVLGTASASWLLPLGMLRGLGEGWYWAGYHLVSYDATSDQNRDRYFGVLAGSTAMLTVALPPTAGTIIVAGAHWGGAYRGYQLVFALAALLLLAAMVLARGLGCGSPQAFSLHHVWNLAHRHPAWRCVTRARLANGASDVLTGILITVLTYVILGNEQSVGGFNGLVGLLGVGATFALGFWARPPQRMAFALIGGSLLVLSTLLLPLSFTLPALVAFGVLRALGGPMHVNALATMSFQVIDRDAAATKSRYEYIVAQELSLGVGRLASLACFLLLAVPMNQMLLARVALVVVGAAPMLSWAFFARMPGAEVIRLERQQLQAA